MRFKTCIKKPRLIAIDIDQRTQLYQRFIRLFNVTKTDCVTFNMQIYECFIQRNLSLAPAPKPPGQNRLICRSELAYNFSNSEGHDGLGRQNQRLNMNIAIPSILHSKSLFNQRFRAFKSSRRPMLLCKKKDANYGAFISS